MKGEQSSAQQSKRQNAAASSSTNNSQFKDLANVKAREEAKTIETSGVGSGSAGQVKRASRASTSNADLLKQSIRSERVIKSNLNSKKPKDKSSQGGNTASSAKRSHASAAVDTS